MKVANIPTVKLTKRGDSLAGTVSRSRNFISKHVKEQLDIVILAGTNDLTGRDVSPESLIEELDSSITELKQFSNLDNVFICKIPARLDRSLINRKVALYNELQRFSDTEEYISVIDTVEPGSRTRGYRVFQVFESSASFAFPRETILISGFADLIS